ncbi:hydroxypyruvate isomerase family protein [Cohnella fermenti]|uniref:Glyoxylate-induced protein n=1 Tax=Cohnella fermenti TaxID=2565925 RepID=A0A4S4BYK5_9BACL|nr:TIM barrel protein [Cohnella fermenti]THF80345.1 glyoxylate-induced protein [Cohnella fermenti]
MIFSPSIDAVFGQTRMSIGEQLELVRAIGYNAFEMWGWWDKELDELERAKDRLELTLASMCTRMVSLVDPACRSRYIAGLQESLTVARRLNCAHLISQTGNLLPGVSREAQRMSLIAGLKEAVPLLAQAGITLLIEPLNTRIDHPGYYLERSSEAFAIIDEVDSPYVKLVFDMYHQQITEGNLIPAIVSHIDRIAYFHMADHPGRHEAGTGEIHYPNVLEAIRGAGYDGYVGMEYFPLSDAKTSLMKMRSQFLHFEALTEEQQVRAVVSVHELFRKPNG